MSVLQLAKVKTDLNIKETTTDARLQDIIDEAEASIAARCGPLQPTPFTYRARGGRASIALPVLPVISLTSVTPLTSTGLGTALDTTLLTVSPAGVLTNLSGAGFGASYYTVTYLAGDSPVPLDLLRAVKEHVRHLFEPARGSQRQVPAAAAPAPGSAYAFSWRVNELMAPYVQAGIA